MNNYRLFRFECVKQEVKDYWKPIRERGLSMPLPLEQGYRIINRSNGLRHHLKGLLQGEIVMKIFTNSRFVSLISVKWH